MEGPNPAIKHLEEKLTGNGGMNGIRDLPPPRISCAEETVSK